jgi:hypothetical protein
MNMNMNLRYTFRMNTEDNEFVNKVGAIKGLRALSGMGLKDAKEFVEKVQEHGQDGLTERISVQQLGEHAEKEALDNMQAGGINAFLVGGRNAVRQSIKDAAVIAIEHDDPKVAIQLLEIIR